MRITRVVRLSFKLRQARRASFFSRASFRVTNVESDDTRSRRTHESRVLGNGLIGRHTARIKRELGLNKLIDVPSGMHSRCMNHSGNVRLLRRAHLWLSASLTPAFRENDFSLRAVTEEFEHAIAIITDLSITIATYLPMIERAFVETRLCAQDSRMICKCNRWKIRARIEQVNRVRAIVR